MGVFPCFLALMGPDAARGIMRNREPTINENLDFLFSRCFFRENFSLCKQGNNKNKIKKN